jgi:antitoxin (DNA-binding transcriptional repressor) of toxin-antitoxin stability system
MKKPPQTVIGVRELRAKLSAHLRAVAGGRTVTIGDRRHRPVARLVPVERGADDEVLDRLAARGIIQRGTGKLTLHDPVKPKRGARLVSDLVIEDRR